MSSASDTTLRRKQRALFADKIVQQETFDKGWKTHIVLEGGSGTVGAMSYPPYYNMVGGSLETTAQELAAYRASVPSQTTVPGPPTAVTAAVGNAEATISFMPPSNNGGAPITSYTVTASPDGFTASGSSSPITVTGLTVGTVYTFTIVATNNVGDSNPSTASNSITAVAVPSAPTDLLATAGNEEITIAFTQSSNGGSPITNYSYSLDGGSFTAFSPSTGSVTTVTITGLTNDTPYTIRLKAINAIGPSNESSPVTETPVEPSLALFTTLGSGTWLCPSGVTSVDYFLVGGGGGGGGAAGTGSGGGGGGGSVKQGTLNVTPGTLYNYTIGDGGAGGLNTSTNGEDGQNTVFATITAEGGGKGYNRSATNLTGQICRGGAAQNGDTPSDGGSGGGTRDNSSSGGLTPSTGAGAGGGGGAGGPGSDGFDATPGDATSAVGGNGGIGIISSVTGSSVEYGKGGKGGNEGFGNVNGANGAANTGNGGQGAQATSLGGLGGAGGKGGSGFIFISWVR